MRVGHILPTILGLLLCAPGIALGHGTGYRLLEETSPPALTFFYTTGEPMRYLEAKVYSPEDERFAHQSGRTDALGRLAFVPNVAGEWRVVVRDEQGHMAEAVVNVGEEALGSRNAPEISTPKPSRTEGSLPFRAALGISVIFNIALAILVVRKRGKEEEATDAH